eukprot:comp6629_c0_seq1/m.2401 comp6629_c0_seq1/g.2401  ORF comp6629_c0_seq1/g.2401 comp6629_c0_seq1/m.2401 type:complete len:305 (-) comp6629_c0_seq1:582-1496(-)
MGDSSEDPFIEHCPRGQHVELQPWGRRIHYLLEGPEHGPLVVCIHGFSAFCWVWNETVPLLLEKGFRVLRFDLFGRGRSDSVDKPHNGTLYTDILASLLEALDLHSFSAPKGKINLIGHSMGGAIVTLMAERYPTHLDRVVLVAPAGFNSAIPQRVVGLPLFGEAVMGLLYYTGWGRYLMPGDFHDATPPETRKLIDRQVATHLLQLSHTPGYLDTLLSVLRNFPLAGLQPIVEAVGRQQNGPRVFVLWGDKDTVCPYTTGTSGYTTCIPRAELHVLSGVGPFCHSEADGKGLHVLVDCLTKLL